MFDAHSYPKGALVLVMLRDLLGDELFFRVLSHFLHRYAFEAVDTNDFIRSVKTVTGQNLDWFFDQWLYKPGHPVFEVRSSWDAARHVVTLRVSQTQDVARGVPVFRVPVAIAVVTRSGRTTHKVWIREREETFDLPADDRPLLVRFDERNVLIKEIHFPKDEDELLYQLRNDDVIGRMAAADLVRQQGDQRTVDALAESAQHDPFWAVRRSAIEALGQVADPRVPATLLKTALDPHSAVRAAVLAALGHRKDPRLAEFFEDRFTNDQSELVKVEALRALGQTGDPSVIPFLQRAGSTPSHRNRVEAAAAEAIKQVGGR